mgnify:FL=1
MQRYKTEYDAQDGEFMRKWGVKIHRRFIGKTRYFPDDREPRNVWEITLERNDGSSYSFRFGDSLVNTAKVPLHKPSDYSILACVSADSWFDCADVWDMVEEYGYDAPNDRREFDKLHRIWVNSSEHGQKLRELFADCLDELQEVQ